MVWLCSVFVMRKKLTGRVSTTGFIYMGRWKNTLDHIIEMRNDRLYVDVVALSRLNFKSFEDIKFKLELQPKPIF